MGAPSHLDQQRQTRNDSHDQGARKTSFQALAWRVFAPRSKVKPDAAIPREGRRSGFREITQTQPQKREAEEFGIANKRLS
jgi:hypothetical protein